MTAGLLVGWSLGAASAATPVVHDGGDAATVLESVAERTGLPADQLRAVPLSDLLDDAPGAVGDATLRRCTRDGTTTDRIRAELSRAEVAWKSRDDPTARDHLDLAVAELGCLTELPERDIAARVFVLRGVLDIEEDPASARGELRTALGLVPDLTPDARYASLIGAALEEERVTAATATVTVAPSGQSSGPWIDGHEVSDSTTVRPGLHLAQSAGPGGVQSAWLVVGGDATLVVPTAYRRPVLEGLTDDDRRPAVEALVAATLPDDSAVYVSHGGGLWLLTEDDDGWTTDQVAAPEPAEPDATPDEEDGGRKKKKRKKRKR